MTDYPNLTRVLESLTAEENRGKGDHFLRNLDVIKRKAVVIANLNYQVTNGGVAQYIDNGYASRLATDTLLDILEIAPCEPVLSILEWIAGSDVYEGRYIDEYEHDDIDNLGLDDAYYAVNEAWLEFLDDAVFGGGDEQA